LPLTSSLAKRNRRYKKNKYEPSHLSHRGEAIVRFGILNNTAARISSVGFTRLFCFLHSWPSSIPVLPEHARTIILFNGTEKPRITARLDGASGTYQIITTDMFRLTSGEKRMVTSEGGTLALDHPVDVGGLVFLRRK